MPKLFFGLQLCRRHVLSFVLKLSLTIVLFGLNARIVDSFAFIDFGVELNRELIKVQQFILMLSLLGFNILYFYGLKIKGDCLRIMGSFFLFNAIILVLFSQRFVQPYLFQDDWYHILAVTKGEFWQGLFIPFVDHVTPLWRGLQFLVMRLFEPMTALIALPYLGAMNIALAATVLLVLLRNVSGKIAFAMALLLITYPGYRSVLFWLSTNAIVLSAAVGLIALNYQWNTVSSRKSSLKSEFIVFLACLGSSNFWTTGIVFSCFCFVWPIFASALNRPFRIARWNTNLRAIFPWGSLFSIVCFLLIRYFAYEFYSDSTVSSIMWTQGGIYHGYEQNLLRPFIWPFLSVFDSLILNGGFRIVRDNTSFFKMVVGSTLFACLIILLAIVKRIPHLFLAYVFAFMSFAVVFVKRGIGGVSHRTPHGYLDYALSNDWYRISALIGVLFLLGLALKSASERMRERVWPILMSFIIVLFAGQSLKEATVGHPLAARGAPMSAMFFRLQCLKKLAWRNVDFAYASKNLFLPMAGSNPGNYWLGYEPSWFDLFIKDLSEIKFEQLVFDREITDKLSNDLQVACDEVDFERIKNEFAVTANSFPITPANEVRPLNIVREGSQLVLLKNEERPNCEFGKFQLLQLEFQSKEKVKDFILKVGSIHWKMLWFDEVPPVLTVDLRALSPHEKCSNMLHLTSENGSLERLLSAKLIATPMNTNYN